MSRLRREDHGRACGFPRVSGDEPRGRAVDGLSPAFSPRERG